VLLLEHLLDEGDISPGKGCFGHVWVDFEHLLEVFEGGVQFGGDLYFLAFVGTPSVTAPWMLQFGGHHLAINLTMAGRQSSMAPSLPATQPATYTLEGRTIRPLGNENDKAFALINALDDGQRKQAVLGSTVSDLVLDL